MLCSKIHIRWEKLILLSSGNGVNGGFYLLVRFCAEMEQMWGDHAFTILVDVELGFFCVWKQKCPTELHSRILN